jgi:Flp pilus assembly protein TadG
MDALNQLMRRRRRGQSLVIIALSATALFGIIALGLDAGRLYFERRNVQNAADAGALAGAQDLIPSGYTSGVTPAMAQQARCDAAAYALKAFPDTPADLTCPAVVSGATTPTQVTITTPSRGNPNEIQVEVSFQVPLTFAAIIGFTQSKVYASAHAQGGFPNRTYTVFSYQTPGAGNTMFYDQNGNVQIDNGLSGQDMCSNNPAQGSMVSNAKFHAPNPNRGYINLNGVFTHAQASDTHAIYYYWYGAVSPTPVAEPIPNYQAVTGTLPDTIGITGGSINGRPAHYYHRGTWHQNINIPGPYSANDYFIFENGLYYFQGVSVSITGGTVANTSDGAPHYINVGPGTFMGGVTNLPAAPDGTNGVEFIFDGAGGFSATSPSAKAPSVFLVAPTFTPAGVTDSIAFYIKPGGSNATPWLEVIDGTKPTDGGFPFQVWGTIFDASFPTTMELQAASAWQSAASPGTYAVTGEFIAPRITLDGGGLANPPSTPSNPAACPNSAAAYRQNPAGLLVQYNLRYVPHFHGYAFLVR